MPQNFWLNDGANFRHVAILAIFLATLALNLAIIVFFNFADCHVCNVHSLRVILEQSKSSKLNKPSKKMSGILNWLCKIWLSGTRGLFFRARAKSGLGPIQELRARTLQKARKTSRVGLGSGSGPGPFLPYYLLKCATHKSTSSNTLAEFFKDPNHHNQRGKRNTMVENVKKRSNIFSYQRSELQSALKMVHQRQLEF